MGFGTKANGGSTTAMGRYTTAIGNNSTAMGAHTTASDYGSLVIGRFNSSGSSLTSAYSDTTFKTSNTAFVIGNGTATSIDGNGTATGVDASDAFKVLFNGDTYVSRSLYLGGTEITSTAAELNLLSGATSLGTGILSPVTENSNTGVRLSTAVAGNYGDIGTYAVDLSYSSSTSTTRGATGNYSTAMGVRTTASGYISTAMGYNTEASGNYSTAMGNNTKASATSSTAMGYITEANGYASTAMGFNSKASDFGSLVIGQFNSSGSSATSVSSATTFNTANTAFVIGNGTATSIDGNGTATGVDASDAFKVLFNGDTYVSRSLYLGGTEITSTAAELNLLSGATSLGTGILSPVTENSNTGVRLSTAVAGNYGDIGTYAVDLSYSSSTSTTRGATGYVSTAMGNNTEASGYASTAMGENTIASGNKSTAMGLFTTASGNNSTAMGIYTTANGHVSTTMGYGTTASGGTSTAMGSGTKASDFASLVIGQYNSSGSSATDPGSDLIFSTANTAFVIGNGVDPANKADAFKVMFNGKTTVGDDLEVKGSVLVSSDARLKANIVSLGATLAKLLLIDGKSYTMKKDGKQKIGVLAQDIQKVFPELVSTDDRDMLAVNYQGLVPVLINAMKEQDAKMKEQQSDIDELKVMVKQLMSDK